jgi:hypothetical protein
MKARIDVKCEEEVVNEETEKKGLFGSHTVITPVTIRKHVVDLYLEASEEVKAIVKLNRLDEIVLASEPVDTSRLEAELETIKDPDKWAVRYSVIQQLKSRRNETKLGDYLSNPWTRKFDSVYEANEYAAKLKTEILPRVKEIITTNSKIGPTSETFEI